MAKCILLALNSDGQYHLYIYQSMQVWVCFHLWNAERWILDEEAYHTEGVNNCSCCAVRTLPTLRRFLELCLY